MSFPGYEIQRMKKAEESPVPDSGAGARASARFAGGQRRTPCVGVCSTTYGDLVCRGCKRFAHEIVDWNSYSDSQRAEITDRLESLRAGAVRLFLTIPEGRSPLATVALLLRDEQQTPACSGLQWRERWAEQGIRIDPQIDSLEQLLAAIDAELLTRSRSVYERSFRVTLQ